MSVMLHILQTIAVAGGLILFANVAVFGPLVWRSWRDGDFR